VDAAWEGFLETQEKTRQLILSQPQYQDGPQSAAEGYRSLLFNMAGAIELSLHDPSFPRFSRMETRARGLLPGRSLGKI